MIKKNKFKNMNEILKQKAIIKCSLNDENKSGTGAGKSNSGSAPAASGSSGHVSASGQRLKDVMDRDLYIPLKTVTDAVNSFFFTPGTYNN